MSQWWESLTLLKQLFYFIAVPATVILVIQAILSIIGLTDGGSDLDGGDFDGADNLDLFSDIDEPVEIDFSEGQELANEGFTGDFKFLTVRGLVAFFTIFGWTGAAMLNSSTEVVSIIVALLAGLAAMGIIGYLFFMMNKLQSSGNIEFINAIGKTGEVYLTVPPKMQGKGKIMVTVQERLIEVNAMTKQTEPIKYGDAVVVVGVMSDHTLIVERQ